MPSDIHLDEYSKINKIIERDSTDTTYKYALLKATIEICQEFQHLGRPEDGKIWFPLGLLIEKWILYYYPVVASDRFIPQKGAEMLEGRSNVQMSFRHILTELTDYYKEKGGGLSQFYNDYENATIPDEISGTFFSLCKKLRDTITQMPMNHLGYSLAKKPYSVFSYRKNEGQIRKPKEIDRDFLVNSFGEYAISGELNSVFLHFGSFISGENTLLLKWATFTSEKSHGTITIAEAMEILQEYPGTERDVTEARQFYHHLWDSGMDVQCVWTGQRIHSLECHIDHMLPFSIWKNNELWNLMPAIPEINSNKSDQIPSISLLEKRKDTIQNYWALMMKFNPVLFEKEIRLSLIGTQYNKNSWQEQAFEALKTKCTYLIETRGYTEWER